MALFDSDIQRAAQRFLETEPAHLKALRTHARAVWNAAEVLAPEGTPPTPTQLALHREAVGRILREHQPAGFWNGRAALEAALDAPIAPGAGALLKDAHRVFLEELEAPLAAARREQLRRWVGAGAGAFACALVAVLAINLAQWLRTPADLAKGKTFTLSSKWADCDPSRGLCGSYPTRVFFHTLEQDQPWFQWDLGAPTTVSWLTIRNRSDAALMRAVPLVVELSDDGHTFHEVARRTERFVDWEPRFAPQPARYVRLRVDRFSALHLEAVQVHR